MTERSIVEELRDPEFRGQNRGLRTWREQDELLDRAAAEIERLNRAAAVTWAEADVRLEPADDVAVLKITIAGLEERVRRQGEEITRLSNLRLRAVARSGGLE